MTTNLTIADLEAALREAKAAEAAKAAEVRESTPIVWRYTIEAVDPRDSFDELYDPTCRYYHLKGEVVNLEEAREAGHPDHSLRGGGMRYVYNMGTERIVCNVGGGTLYIGRSWRNPEDDSHVVAMRELSAFLASNPEGGDITEIVEKHRRKSGDDD